MDQVGIGPALRQYELTDFARQSTLVIITGLGSQPDWIRILAQPFSSY